MNVTCGTSCRAIFNIITGPEPICHSTRIVLSLAQSNLPLQATLSPSRRWAVCIIATSGAPPELSVNEPTRAGFGVKDRCISNLCAHTQRCSEFPFISHLSQPSAMYGPSNEFSRDHLQPDSHAKYIFQQGHRVFEG